MQMNEIQTFDYSIVDDQTAQFLQLKEQEMQSIVLNSSIQLGEKLIEAQEKLAKFNTGIFEKWFTSIGMKKQTIYNYINQAQFVHQMDEYKQIEMFQELPTTLRTEISKSSAVPEAVELVLSGDIKTTKEYRELEKQLKQKDKQIESLSDVITDLDKRKPETIEKIPLDYSIIKEENKELKKSLESVKSSLKLSRTQYELLEKNTEEARILEENINRLRKKEKGFDERVKATMEFNTLLREINVFFDKNMASLRFKPLVNELSDTEAVSKLSDVVSTIEFWTEEMRKILPNQNTKIIEGEIILE